MANQKSAGMKLEQEAIEHALALDELFEESARQGAARIEAMSDDEVERFLSDDDFEVSNENVGYPVAAIIWQGLLSTLIPLRAMPGIALANESSVKHLGAKADLAVMLGNQAERDDLAWTTGSLRIEAAYSDMATIESLRISVNLKRPVHSSGRSLLVTLADRVGGIEILSLRADVPSVTLSRPLLAGAFADLELTVSVGEGTSRE